MPRRKVYERFIDLPQGVQDFFMEKADDIYIDLIEKYNLSKEHFFEMIETPVLNATLGIKTVPDALNGLFQNLISAKLDKNSMRAIIKALLEKIFWPLRDLFEDELKSYLVELGVETATWPQERVLFKPISYSGAVSEILNRLNMGSLGKQARAAMRDVIAKYSKGELVPTQIIETMVRLPEFGGLGFDKETANKALVEIQNLSKQVEFLTEEEYADQLSNKTVKMHGKSSAESEAIEDEAEIKSIREAMPKEPKVLTVLDEAVKAALAACPNKPKDEYLERRLENVISSRLRDVRNSTELLQLLQRDTKVGGLGLDREQAQTIAATIEKVYQDFHGRIESEEKKKLDKQLTAQRQKIEERRLQEASEHAKWYQEKIKAKQEHDIEQKQFAEALKVGLGKKSELKHPVQAASDAKEKQRYGQLVPVAQKAPAMAMAGAAGSVKVSLATAKMAASPTTIDGIRGVPRPSGLQGELEGLTLQQFRRMGASPAEAIKKILERMETLRQDSLEKKVAGIRAWQSSPVMKMYLGLVAESFKNQKPIGEIAEAKRKAGEDSLTRDEIEALIQLNNQLHF